MPRCCMIMRCNADNGILFTSTLRPPASRRPVLRSWNTTGMPSLVSRTSISAKSAPFCFAARMEASEFSGACRVSPRCAMTIGRCCGDASAIASNTQRPHASCPSPIRQAWRYMPVRKPPPQRIWTAVLVLRARASHTPLPYFAARHSRANSTGVGHHRPRSCGSGHSRVRIRVIRVTPSPPHHICGGLAGDDLEDTFDDSI